MTSRYIPISLLTVILFSCSSAGHVDGNMYWNRKLGFAIEVPGGQWTYEESATGSYVGAKVEAIFIRKGSTLRRGDQILIGILKDAPDDLETLRQQIKLNVQQRGGKVDLDRSRQFGDIETFEISFSVVVQQGETKARSLQHTFIASGKPVVISFVSTRTISDLRTIDQYIHEFEQTLKTLRRI